MKTFFTPSSWGKNSEVIEFKAIKGGLSGNAEASVGKKIKKSKGKKKSKKEKSGTGEGPLAPTAIGDKDISTHKVKTGRVEKHKNAKQQKKQQQKLKLTPALAAAATEAIVSTPSPTPNTINNSSGISALEAKLKEQLLGGRFRFLNEQLYTLDSREAQTLFQEDADAFGAYHDGYRHQVEKWPLNPLNRIIKMIKRLPKSFEIVDFGCGEGQLARSIPNKVYSIDLVAKDPDIIACDMANTPLKPQTLDVAVYCLSLMGTNLTDFLLEANRVLKIGGHIYIAEIQSRIEDAHKFVRGLEGCGFELVKQDRGAKVFYFFQFKKVRNVGKVAVIPEITLKPCLYRKR